jgi:23S rRNA (cytosine1962-C5)-methyltransferase
VTSLDTSAEALDLARHNAGLNAFDAARSEWMAADVFSQLRKFRDQGRKFDLVVLDPPKFAPTEKHVPNAARAYKDINLWAMKLLAPGGHLLTFSCSSAVSPDLFQKIVAGAAAMRASSCRSAATWARRSTIPCRSTSPRANT